MWSRPLSLTHTLTHTLHKPRTSASNCFTGSHVYNSAPKKSMNNSIESEIFTSALRRRAAETHDRSRCQLRRLHSNGSGTTAAEKTHVMSQELWVLMRREAYGSVGQSYSILHRWTDVVPGWSESSLRRPSFVDEGGARSVCSSEWRAAQPIVVKEAAEGAGTRRWAGHGDQRVT